MTDNHKVELIFKLREVKKMFKRKGQSTLEYALIIAVVVAGLLLMQYYVRRGFAGRLKTATDDMGEQYDPTGYSGSFAINQTSNTRQKITNVLSNTSHLTPQVSSRTGSENIIAWTAGANLYAK
jgi:uncharacterized protein (UPF0333 family)